MNDAKIVFMGTPDFAVPSLDILVKKGYNVTAVITAPDKPAGRGRKLTASPVKKYAVENGLRLLQPAKLKDPSFLAELNEIAPDLQVVVAFRMLPKEVWSLPEYGTFNLHASLLPQYRGAAPINHAIINGEKITGVTTFFIDENIDTGKIIAKIPVEIDDDETAGELHDKLMYKGAELVLKTVEDILSGNVNAVEQSILITQTENIKPAPKIFKDDCRINWGNKIDDVYNFIRGLSPYPGAFTELVSPEGKTFFTKILRSTKIIDNTIEKPGKIVTGGKEFLQLSCTGGLINITELQIAGKRRMSTPELLRGFHIDETWKVA